MKALVVISRVGQIIILAIVFMACVGWNQAAGLQNNISSITRRRVKDIVRIRYILPYRSLHTVPEPCTSFSAAFEGQKGTNDFSKGYVWNSTENSGKQSQFCNAAASQSPFQQAKMVRTSLEGTAFSWQSKPSNFADAFQGQGYFSGFSSSSTFADFVDETDQEKSPEGFSLISVETRKDAASTPVYIAFGSAGCTVTVCHTKGSRLNAYTQTTSLEVTDSGESTSSVQDLAGACPAK